jgi:hypothetical protein
LTGVRASVLGLLAVVALAAGCGGAKKAAETAPQKVAIMEGGGQPVLADAAVRSPHLKTDMDTNPANLASAVITYSFGQLPQYIDGAGFRLLPHDVEQASVPGRTSRRVYRITTPRTRLVLDTVYTAAPTADEAKQLARAWKVDVSLDGRHLRQPDRFWVFYRNNGPQICRIYFPGDLGSLNMGANSIVFHPLSPGRHSLVVRATQDLGGSLGSSTLIADYRLRVLARRPNDHERELAPEEDSAPPAGNRTPLTFRTQSSS